ncbi:MULTISPECIES: Crp/Fnr family transcriptional regulator [Zobellia]|uniref:Crp/Fnr family transcriptional regulator n=1 Tax=Zobellia TaxID=112040 RepID=UPI001BFF9612|nr:MULTISPECIES: Crp/Fnr family transcriptional regulator [Zobellia]MBT9187562.1 Crp/Fnr family transcriptional regulator [Zobellia russellii]MBU2975542.1 Crp/Fnr family transcriptional regulator [Zobellia sp. B3R18]
MSHDLLLEHIEKNAQLSKTEQEVFCSFFHPKSIERKEFLLQQGQVCKFEGFVTEGCFRVFTLDKKGNENTLYFAVKDWWLMDIDSFMNQIPSDLNIEAIEDSKILLINRQDKLALYNSLPVAEKIFRIMFQKGLVSWQRRLVRNHCLTAKERYLHFIQTYPEISSKLTDKQIAGYLGIRHEFLSKIKKSVK